MAAVNSVVGRVVVPLLVARSAVREEMDAAILLLELYAVARRVARMEQHVMEAGGASSERTWTLTGMCIAKLNWCLCRTVITRVATSTTWFYRDITTTVSANGGTATITSTFRSVAVVTVSTAEVATIIATVSLHPARSSRTYIYLGHCYARSSQTSAPSAHFRAPAADSIVPATTTCVESTNWT